MEALIAWLVLINVVGLAMMGIDKAKAQTDKQRIPERSLFLAAILGGSVGCLAGMYIFRHKTRHWQFRLGLPAILVCHLVLAGWLLGLF